MPALLARYERNERGRDFAVGDIHGHFTRLQAALDRIGFDPGVDRLFSVGDLVDRGPECEQALIWLAQPWFHAVRGNHEDIAMRYAKGNPVDVGSYIANGGEWFVTLDPARRPSFAQAFSQLPLAIEVQTDAGPVGIVHADCPVRDWSRLGIALRLRRAARDRAMWTRERLQREDASGVAGLRALVVGHTPVAEPVVLGNVFHIDTGGWMPGGRFTLLDLDTLEVATDAS
ncbi:serine/threonine protein phosphatase [Pigmentiphaga sp. NML080357]|uniref:metallophosphoesterase n=1 Tax=Pigmentiphaga sp. NML080357 TaxID=2008675 RepID=UPI000B41CE4F|nr:metallophosphoesterase [Pigmentiphaga sp. NML080357]OVZ57178.1 serine/threonine protein phosphatase [Pigmentiphaga sp. NML080357]